MGTKLCEICGKSPARYICQQCGRDVCERCLEPHTWLCAECYRNVEKEVPELEEKGVSVSFPFFMKIFLLGFFLIFIGVAVLIATSLIYGMSDSLGIIVFIGPIPIILGAGRYSLLAIILAIILHEIVALDNKESLKPLGGE